MYPYRYHVAYDHAGMTGACAMNLPAPISSWDVVQQVVKPIIAKGDGKSAPLDLADLVVLSWQRYEDPA